MVRDSHEITRPFYQKANGFILMWLKIIQMSQTEASAKIIFPRLFQRIAVNLLFDYCMTQNMGGDQ